MDRTRDPLASRDLIYVATDPTYKRKKEMETQRLCATILRMPGGRKPKIAAPAGSKGCPRCLLVLPLIDPASGESNFAHSGYCRACALAKTMEYKREQAEKRAAERGVPPSTEDAKYEKIAVARITPFPRVAGLPPYCSCCHRAPKQSVAGLPFCERCAYYVAACGRCVDHSFREFVPELRGNPDPPLLSVEATAPVPPYAGRKTRAPGADETDLLTHP